MKKIKFRLYDWKISHDTSTHKVELWKEYLGGLFNVFIDADEDENKLLIRNKLMGK